MCSGVAADFLRIICKIMKEAFRSPSKDGEADASTVPYCG